MPRAQKLDLRVFQQELAARLASKTAAQVESSRLGLSGAGQQWLIRLSDAAEVIAMPAIASVPLTKPWFLGLANIRARLKGLYGERTSLSLRRNSPTGVIACVRVPR